MNNLFKKIITTALLALPMIIFAQIAPPPPPPPPVGVPIAGGITLLLGGLIAYGVKKYYGK